MLQEFLLEINIACDPESLLLVSHGARKSSLNELEFTDKYMEATEKAEDIVFLMQRRDFKVPVLNRDDKIEITFLITTQGKGPILNVNCDYPGVKMKYDYQESNQIFGEPQKQCAIIGLIIALLLGIPIFYIPNKIIAVYVGIIIGLVATVFGILLRKLGKFIIKFLS